MTTLHLLPSIGHQTASTLKQNALAMFDETQSLRRALQSLEMSWQGGGQEQFSSQANALIRNLQTQADALQFLAERLEREVTEWEETDQRGAQALRALASPFFTLLYSGGGGAPSFQTGTLPVFAALEPAVLLTTLPLWLQRLLERLFPPPHIHAPIVEEAPKKGALAETIRRGFERAQPTRVVQRIEVNPGLGVTQPEAPQPTAAQPPVSYDVYHQVPVHSQGNAFGSAACLPTALGMVTEYHHARSADLKSVSPSDLIAASDPGDGTSGKGFGFDSLNDEMDDRGYKVNLRTGNLQELEKALKEGPLIANVKVDLTSGPARDIRPGNGYYHSVVVKGMNADSVVINDPWSGAEKVFSRTDFEGMWRGGGNLMLEVRPKQ